MKIIEKEIITKKTQYQATDGTVFDTKEDCIEYERTHPEGIYSAWEKLKKIEFSGVEIGIPLAEEEGTAFVICPRTINEIDVINSYIQLKVNVSFLDMVTKEDLNQVILLDFGYQYLYCYKYNLKEHLNEINQMGKKFLNYFLEEQNSEVLISFKEALKFADIKLNEWISIIQENEIDKKYPNYILYIYARDIDTYFDANKIQVIKMYPVFLDGDYKGIRFVIKNNESFDSAYSQIHGM